MLSLIVCFTSVCFLMAPTPSFALASPPLVMNDQGFVLTVAYYYVRGPFTIVAVGSVVSPESVMLRSLNGSASIDGVPVGTGAVDESNLRLQAGVPAPLSAIITTNFNIYEALWLGRITTGDGTAIPFRYDSTPITVVLSGQLCALGDTANCFPWPDFNQTTTLALL